MRTVQHQLPTGQLTLQVEEARFPLDWLIGVAARATPGRGFLFLSKVLGKHWPVTPRAMEMLHDELATQIPAGLPGPVVFIALAETAIGLGQGVFESSLQGRPERRALFLHSTRYRIDAASCIEFDDGHSHAPRQFLHLSDEAAALFASARSLVLIDDKASTGNTLRNLATACRARNPAIERIHLCLIANFMGREGNAALPGRFGLPVTVGAALTGHYHFEPGTAPLPAAAPAQRLDAGAAHGASTGFGRIGLQRALQAPQRLAAQLAGQIDSGASVLVLGTGEFMHPAFLLARELEALGKRVLVQSTTRSPILPGGAVGHALRCVDNYREGVANYLYNVAPGQYQHVFICHETPPGPALAQLARQLNGRLLHFQSETAIVEVEANPALQPPPAR